MKVRIGLGFGGTGIYEPGALSALVEGIEGRGFDSLWVNERISAATPDPMVVMAHAAARTTTLKFGTSVMVLPGRNPVLVAKAMATLDQLSGGRVLPMFGLGQVSVTEQQAFAIERAERAPWFDEALPLMRRLWSEDHVTHHGERFHLDDFTLLPKPVKGSLDVWLGGIAPSELRRTGRLGDGWLPSFVDPDQVRSGIETVNNAAADAGRSIDPEHFGVLIVYGHDELSEAIRTRLVGRRPGIDPDAVVARGIESVAELVPKFVAAGASKFVIQPLGVVDDWDAELDELAQLLPLEAQYSN